MKKTIFIVSMIMIIYYLIGISCSEILKIPDEAIRLRIIPNSNSSRDQEVKSVVKKEIQEYMATVLQKVDNIDMSRTVISSKLPEISNKIDSIFDQEKYDLTYKINFGLNYFPDKEYKGIKYDAGNYESLVITIGEGMGDNWWCVLFPPLCLIEAEESSEIEYTSFVKEVIDKYV